MLGLISTVNPLWYRTFNLLSKNSLLLGRKDLFQDLVRRFMGVEPGREGIAAYLECGAELLSTYGTCGEREAARQLLDRMEKLVHGSSPGDPAALMWLRFGELQLLRFLEGDPWGAYLAGQAALTAAAATRSPLHLSTMAAAASLIELALGSPTAAAALHDSLLELRRLHDDVHQANATAFLALHLSARARDLEEARQAAHEALAHAAKGAVCSGIARLALSRVLAAQGRFTEAEGEARSALGALSNSEGLQLGVYAQLGRVLMKQCRHEEARSLLDTGMRKLQAYGEIGYLDLELRLADIESHFATHETELGRARLAVALAILHGRAERIRDREWRQRYRENVVENQQLRALARTHLDRIEPAAARRIEGRI